MLFFLYIHCRKRYDKQREEATKKFTERESQIAELTRKVSFFFHITYKFKIISNKIDLNK